MKKKKNNKRRGFTLIELLAVILILGVIALIAVPQVNNVIEASRKGASETSAKNYVGAVNNQLAISKIDSDSTNDIADGTQDVQNITVDMSGSQPTSGSVFVYKGSVAEAELEVNGRKVLCDKDNCTAIDKYVYYTKTYSDYASMPKLDNVSLSDTTDTKPSSSYYIKLAVAGGKLINPQLCINDNTEFCVNPNEYEITKKKLFEWFGYDKTTWHEETTNYWYNSTKLSQCIIEEKVTACSINKTNIQYQIGTSIPLGQINIAVNRVGTCHVSDDNIGCIKW